MKVLYGDVKKVWHELIDRVLVPRGIEVIHSFTLKETLNKINLEKPEIAILNVTLKNGKAYEIIPDIIKLGVPVILVGYENEGLSESEAGKVGIKFVLKKPFVVDELFRTINEARLQKPEIVSESSQSGIIHSGEQLKEAEEITIPEKPVSEVSAEEDVDVLNMEPEFPVDESSDNAIEIVPLEDTSFEEISDVKSEEFAIPSEKGISIESGDIKEHEKLAAAFGVSEDSSEEKESLKTDAVEPEIVTDKVADSEVISRVEDVAESKLIETESSSEEQTDISQTKEELTEEIKKQIREEIRAVIWEVVPDIAEKVLREEIEEFIKSRLA